MVKYVCNRCGVELTKAEQKPLTFSTRRIVPKYATYTLHLCDNCLLDFVGKEEMENIKEAYEEYLKTRNERRKARECNNE